MTTTLAQARQKAADCRAWIAQGLDPLEVRQTGVELRKNRRTFGECADKLIASKRAAWRSPKHAQEWVTSLGRPCAAIRGVPIAEIDTAAILQVLQPLWAKTETAVRLRGRIEAVLDYAKAQGWRSGENCARWKGHLENLLPGRSNLARGHHAAMDYHALPKFMKVLRTHETGSVKACEFLILTATRLSEVTKAVWAEIDLAAAIWTIPAVRMKSGREHRVPLAPGALAILHDVAEYRTASPFIFPGYRRARPLSGAGFRTLLPAGTTIHGFRAAFSTWAAEQRSFAFEVREQALAHQTGNAASRAYDRSDLLAKRRALMTAWAEFCASGNATASF